MALWILLALVCIANAATPLNNPLDDDSFLFAPDPTKMAQSARIRKVPKTAGPVLAELAALVGGKGIDDSSPVDDMIDQFIDQIKQGNTQAFGGAKATVLANSNVLNHRDKNNNNFMSRILRTKEEGQKSEREEEKKNKSEASEKAMESNNKKDIRALKEKMQSEEESKEKQEDDELAEEEGIKSSEANTKANNEQTTKKTLETQREAARKASAKAEKELAKQRAQEAQDKQNDEQKNKQQIDNAIAKAEGDRKQAERDDEQDAKNEETKKKTEEESEQAEKKSLREAEESEKSSKRNALGTRCGCTQQSTPITDAPGAYYCPADTLLVGLNVAGSTGSWKDVTYFLCCRPCGPDGDTRMQVTMCNDDKGWQTTFNKASWSYCSSNTFLQGWAKNNGDEIASARCCSIAGSRGPTGDTLVKWPLTVVGSQPSKSDKKDTFVTGMKRDSSSRFIGSISQIQESQFFAYL